MPISENIGWEESDATSTSLLTRPLEDKLDLLELLKDHQHQSTFSVLLPNVIPVDTLTRSGSEEASLLLKLELPVSLHNSPEPSELQLITEDTVPTSWRKETLKDYKDSRAISFSSQELLDNQRRVKSTIQPPDLKETLKTLLEVSMLSQESPEELVLPLSPRKWRQRRLISDSDPPESTESMKARELEPLNWRKLPKSECLKNIIIDCFNMLWFWRTKLQYRLYVFIKILSRIARTMAFLSISAIENDISS